MKRVPFLLLALTVVFACTDTVTQPEPAIDLVVSFGVEPSPFRMPTINNLEAAAHHLEVIRGHISSLCVLSVPPDPVYPPDPCTPSDLPATAIIGTLGAMTNQLTALNSRVGELLPPRDDAVPPPEFTAAVVLTFGAARNVWNEAYLAKLGFEPMPFWPALDAVKGAAMTIMRTIDGSDYCPDDVSGIDQCQVPEDEVPLPS